MWFQFSFILRGTKSKTNYVITRSGYPKKCYCHHFRSQFPIRQQDNYYGEDAKPLISTLEKQEEDSSLLFHRIPPKSNTGKRERLEKDVRTLFTVNSSRYFLSVRMVGAVAKRSPQSHLRDPGSIPVLAISCGLSLLLVLSLLRGFFSGLSGFPPTTKINTHPLITVFANKQVTLLKFLSCKTKF